MVKEQLGVDGKLLTSCIFAIESQVLARVPVRLRECLSAFIKVHVHAGN